MAAYPALPSAKHLALDKGNPLPSAKLEALDKGFFLKKISLCRVPFIGGARESPSLVVDN